MARRDTYGPQYRALIAKLVASRRAAGIKQVDLARALDIDQSQVSKIERGERRLDVIDYLRLCRAIGVDPCEPLRSVSF